MEYMDHSCWVLFIALHVSDTNCCFLPFFFVWTWGNRAAPWVPWWTPSLPWIPKDDKIILWQRLEHKVLILPLTWLQTTPATQPHFSKKQHMRKLSGGRGSPPHTTPPSQPQEQKPHYSPWNYSNKTIYLTRPTLPPHTKWNDPLYNLDITPASQICSVASHKASD